MTKNECEWLISLSHACDADLRTDIHDPHRMNQTFLLLQLEWQKVQYFYCKNTLTASQSCRLLLS